MKVQIDNRHQDLRSDFLLPLIVFALIWGTIFIASGILNAGFNYFIDDHEILVIQNIHTSFQDIFVEPFTALFSNEPKSRFRPLYDVLLRLCTKLYGLNPFAWYLSSLLVAMTTSIILYLVGRLQKFSQLEAIGFAGLIVFGQQASTYTRFGTPETTATLFVTLSFLFGSISSKALDGKLQQSSIRQIIYNYLFVIFAVLAALNKEACILILPALAYFKVWHLSRTNNISLKESFDLNRANVISVLISFISFLAYIKLAPVVGPGYAGIDKDTLSIVSLFGSLVSNGAIFGSAIIGNIGYHYISRSEQHEKVERSFYILAALVIIPQLIIYNKTGMNWHYILPASIGVSFLAFYPVSKLAKKSSKSYRIVLCIVLTILTLQVIFTGSYFDSTSKRTAPIESLVSSIRNCVGKNAPLAIVGNPYVDYELLTSFYRIADLAIDNHQTVLATYGSRNSNLVTDALKTEEQTWYFLDPKSIENVYKNRTIDRLNPQALGNLKGIVLTHAGKVEQSLVALNLDWFHPDLLVKKYYSELDISVYCKK
jgi:Dolichyl-phosphate-mannose-protein mannosyltransferase